MCFAEIKREKQVQCEGIDLREVMIMNKITRSFISMEKLITQDLRTL